MDNELAEIKRLAGIDKPVTEQMDPMAQMRQLISGVDQAIGANDLGRAKAILRDMYRLTGGADESY